MISTDYNHFLEKVSIQFCDSVGIRINLEDTTTIEFWKTVNDATTSNCTCIPLLVSITKLRSDVSRGFADRIEFDHSTSFERNAMEPLGAATDP